MTLKTEADWNRLTSIVIACAIEVHRELGPGLIESVYQICLLQELREAGLQADMEVPVEVEYKGKRLGKRFSIDILVENALVLELKAVENMPKVFQVKTLTYLRLSHKKLGLLINFHETLLKNGIRRIINGDLNSP